MKNPLLRSVLLLPVLSLLSACSLAQAKDRIGVLVLIPAVLVIIVMWLLNRRGGEENWEEKRFPDSEEDDDREDHHLM